MSKKGTETTKSRIKKQPERPGNAGICLAAFFFLVEAFLVFGFTWLLSIWHDITFDEIVFYLSAPLEGTSKDVMNSFYLRVVLFSVLAVILFTASLIALRLRKRYAAYKRYCLIVFLALSAVLICQIARAAVRYRVPEYIRSRITKSDFIEQNYVEPTASNVSFPEKKRNLVYIFLESVETTYADRASGGCFCPPS